MTIWKPNIKQFSGPRYKALAEAIAGDIKLGVLKPEQRLPTHRALAEVLGVTVGTITRGYAEAERRELVVARVGSGTFVRSGKVEDFGFEIPEQQQQEGVIDLRFSMTLPGQEEEFLADSLLRLSQNQDFLRGMLSYQPESGMLRHREAASRWLHLMGIDVTASQVQLCIGGQHGISMTLQAITRPGDTVLSEGLTYPGFISIARQLHLRHLGLPMDDFGIIPAQLELLCQQFQPRVLYCTPTLHNPTSVTMPLERRREILAICRKYDLYLIEDEVQAALPLDRPPAMVLLDPERVIHVSSYSKSLAGGLRVGFLVAPESLQHKIANAIRSNCWMPPPLMAEIASDWIFSGKAQQLMTQRRKEIDLRYQLVTKVFEGLDYQHGMGGYNVWLLLPEPWRAGEFMQQAEQNGVLVKASEIFTVGRFPAPHGVRIGISSPASLQTLEKGLRILRQTLEEEPMIWQTVV